VPRDATVVAVVRDDHLIVPRGDTRLAIGDEVLVLVTADAEDMVQQLLVGPEPMRAAFFDLDKTVIAKASIAAFGRPFYRGGLINRRLVARAAGVPAHLPPPRGRASRSWPGCASRCSP
jgi:hypothetical protein